MLTFKIQIVQRTILQTENFRARLWVPDRHSAANPNFNGVCMEELSQSQCIVTAIPKLALSVFATAAPYAT